MSKTEAPNDPDTRPAVGGPVQRQVRPRAWIRETGGTPVIYLHPAPNAGPLYDDAALDAASDEVRQIEAAAWGETAAMQAAEIERLQALLTLQQASYEREILLSIAAERERCCAILKARECLIAAEAEKAALREPDEVSALRATAWQLAVAEREIRGPLVALPHE